MKCKIEKMEKSTVTMMVSWGTANRMVVAMIKQIKQNIADEVMKMDIAVDGDMIEAYRKELGEWMKVYAQLRDHKRSKHGGRLGL